MGEGSLILTQRRWVHLVQVITIQVTDNLVLLLKWTCQMEPSVGQYILRIDIFIYYIWTCHWGDTKRSTNEVIVLIFEDREEFLTCFLRIHREYIIYRVKVIRSEPKFNSWLSNWIRNLKSWALYIRIFIYCLHIQLLVITGDSIKKFVSIV